MNITQRLLTAIALLLGGCTLNEGDNQIIICQQLTAHLNRTQDIQWKQANKVTGSDHGMNVIVRWDQQSAKGTTPMQASCHFNANEDDDSENFDPDFNDAYESTPDSLFINGDAVPAKDLYLAIYQITGQSIKDTVKEEHLHKKTAEVKQAIQSGTAHVKEKAGIAARAIREGSEKLKQKAGEALKQAGEKLQQ